MISVSEKFRMRLRSIFTILVLTVLHFFTCIFLLITVFGNSMGRLDKGGEPAFHERMLDIILSALLFPVEFILERLPSSAFPGLWGYIPFFLNSLLWGLGLYHLLVYMYIGIIKRGRTV